MDDLDRLSVGYPYQLLHLILSSTRRRQDISSIQLAARLPGVAFVVSGILLLVGGQLHPRADISLDFDAARAGMLAESLWRVSHVLTLAGIVLVGVALLLILRSGGLASHRSFQLLAVVAFGGTSLHAVEMLPHIFQNMETAEVLSGGSTPINDIQLVLQAISNPVFGIGIAGLAVVGARTRYIGHWTVAVLAVLGGLAFAVAGPAVLITRQPEFSLLFLGSIGMAVWLIIAGIRAAWRPTVRLDAELKRLTNTA